MLARFKDLVTFNTTSLVVLEWKLKYLRLVLGKATARRQHKTAKHIHEITNRSRDFLSYHL